MKRELICVSCPRGCLLSVEQGASDLVVRGNRCPKGEAYGKTEIMDPRRIVTTTVRAEKPDSFCIPVKTDQPLPKGMIRALLDQLRTMTVALPVKRGQIIVSNFNHSGINVVCSRSYPLEPPLGDL